MNKQPKGRAIKPNQKKDLLDRIYLAWLQCPQLRLGQLIANVFSSTGADTDANGTPYRLYPIEDEDLLNLIEEFAYPKHEGI